MRVLIAFEQTGVMRRAFAARGHDAWSLDLAPDESTASPVDFPAYIVTSHGRVLSSHHGKIAERKPSSDAKGYKCITLCNGRAKRLQARVHQLVAAAFVPNPHSLPCVRHLDGNPANNRAGNLAWGTYFENEADKIGHGTWDARRTGKLTESHRDEARKMLAAGALHKDVAAQFGVSRPTITRLANGSTWGPTRGTAAAADQWGGWALQDCAA